MSGRRVDRRPGGRRCVLLALGLVAAVSSPATAQWPFRDKTPDFEQHNVPYSGRYVFVRLSFTPSRTGYGGGGGFFGGINYQWDHDYPTADRNFSTIVGELTYAASDSGHNIIAIGSPEIFKYPIAYMSEPGWWTMTEEEVANLRSYFLKGGFIIFDDFAGSSQGSNFVEQIRRILPEARLTEVDPSHSIFHSFFEIERRVIEEAMHPYFGGRAQFVGAYEDNDPSKRLLFIANFNNDIGDAWEWSNTGYIPIALSNEAYKLGVNYLVYAMTH